MRIITRYLLTELTKVFLVTLTSMTTFVFLVLIGKEAVENGLGLAPILKLVPYILPQAMQFAVPGSMLLATTSVYGRVAASNELVAAKALGISPLKLVWPTFVLAALVSLGAVKLNDLAVSWGRGGAQRVVLESLEEIAYGRFRTTRSYSNQQLKANVRAVHGKRLIKPHFMFYASADKPAWSIAADEASLETDTQHSAITLTLVNAEIDFGGKGSATHPGKWPIVFSLSEFTGHGGRSKSTSSLSLKEIGPAKQRQHELIDLTRQESAAQASYAMLTGSFDQLSTQTWDLGQNKLRDSQRTMYRLNTEPQRRVANGFSCLCFALIGAPMAIRLRHGEFWGSFFACFLPILIVYYPMLVHCVSQSKNGAFPPPAVWLGNLVLAVWGIWLMRRVIRF